MNQVFTVSTLAVLTLALWLLGKKPKALMGKGFQGKSSINQPSLVQPLEPVLHRNSHLNAVQTQFKPPITSREKYELRNHLKKMISSLPDERLLAVEMASEWGDSSVVPILKIGLRDMDSRVVIKSARAISKFKNKSIDSKTKKVISHPLNVFLMR